MAISPVPSTTQSGMLAPTVPHQPEKEKEGQQPQQPTTSKAPEEHSPWWIKGVAGKSGQVAATIHNDALQQWYTKRIKSGIPVTSQEMIAQLRSVAFRGNLRAGVGNKAFGGSVFFLTQDQARQMGYGVAGATLIATVAEEVASQPLNAMRFQLNEKNANCLGEAFKYIYKQSGARGLYRGFPLILVQSGLNNVIAFTLVDKGVKALNEAYKDQGGLTPTGTVVAKAGIGAMGSAVILPVTYPLFRALCEKRRGDTRWTFEIIKDLHSKGTLYKGVSMSFTRMGLANAGLFGAMAIAEEAYKHRKEITTGAKEAGEKGLSWFGSIVHGTQRFGETVVTFLFPAQPSRIDGNKTGKIHEYDTTDETTDQASKHYHTESEHADYVEDSDSSPQQEPESPKPKVIDPTGESTDPTTTHYHTESEHVDLDSTNPSTDPAATHSYCDNTKPSDNSNSTSSTTTSSPSSQSAPVQKSDAEIEYDHLSRFT